MGPCGVGLVHCGEGLDGTYWTGPLEHVKMATPRPVVGLRVDWGGWIGAAAQALAALIDVALPVSIGGHVALKRKQHTYILDDLTREAGQSMEF
jgi:hypothetical protein